MWGKEDRQEKVKVDINNTKAEFIMDHVVVVEQ
jgi:hypothetical protein